MSNAATQEERDLAHRNIVGLVLDELQRVVVAINVDQALGMKIDLVLRLHSYGGPELVVEQSVMTGAQLATLQQLLGQNLDVELHDGKITIYSPSWPPDRFPF